MLRVLRTQAVCWLHRLLAEFTPGGMRRELTAGKADALLARIRPGDDVARIRLQLARDHLAGIRALDARMKTAGSQISDLVTAAGTNCQVIAPNSRPVGVAAAPARREPSAPAVRYV